MLIIFSIWLVGCALVTVLLGVFYSQSRVEALPTPQPVATYTLTFEGETAKSAYQQALAKAQQWQGDVELVAASAYWPETTLEALTKFDAWDFRFYSPSRRRIYFAVAHPNEPVIGRPHIFKQDTFTPLVDPTAWVIDSDEAVEIWVNNGGGPFLETFPGSSVEVLLHHMPKQDLLVWDVIGVSQDQSQLFFLSINAGNGNVVE
ncbi:MAG: hypothetical protein Kow0031_29470 [Anaerolineae bacterium]